MQKYIGILGGSGTVGNTVIRTLRDIEPDRQMLAGSRHSENISTSGSMTAMNVDIADKAKLMEFCSKCSTVINCIGPSDIIGKNVADACVENGANYVEVSGDERLGETLYSMSDTFAEQGLKCVFSAGVNPGLTEMWAYHNMKKYALDSLAVYFSGSGSLSENAAIDMIVSCNSGKSQGMSYIEGGRIEKICNFEFDQELPQPTGKAFCIPVVDMDFLRLAKLNNIRRAHFYNAFGSYAIAEAMMTSKMSAGASLTELAEKLRAAFEADKNARGKEYTCIHLLAEKDGKKLTESLVYNSSWNELTGIVGALTALAIEKGKSLRTGTGDIWEIIDNEWFFENLLSVNGILKQD